MNHIKSNLTKPTLRDVYLRRHSIGQCNTHFWSKLVFGALCLLISFNSHGQNKREQITILHFKIDSLNLCIDSLNELSNTKIASLNREVQLLNTENKNLSYDLNQLEILTNQHKRNSDKLNKQLDSLISASKTIKYDTISASITHECYYYNSDFPYIISAPYSDESRIRMNSKIRDLSFRIPSIMQNEDYKAFRSCKEGDYNHTTALHDKHAASPDCDWCQSLFHSTIEYVEQGRYFSVLMAVGYSAGGNWGHLGYNAITFKEGQVISIPTNPSVKSLLLAEIKEYLTKSPMIDRDGNPYPILKEIEKWDLSDLTFYFKNDTMHLIFNNGAYGIWNQTFDMPLPLLQRSLNL